MDRKGNTALHLACRGAKYETIALLLDKYDDDEKLPWESNEVLDRERESVEYYYGGGISSTEGLPRDYEHLHWCKDATFIGCLTKSDEKDCSQWVDQPNQCSATSKYILIKSPLFFSDSNLILQATPRRRHKQKLE